MGWSLVCAGGRGWGYVSRAPRRRERMTCCPLCRVCHGRGSSWSGDCVPVIVVLGGQGSRLPGGQCKWPVDGRGCPGGRSGVGASDAAWPAALACGWSRRCPQLAPGAVRPMPPSPSPPAGRGRHAVAPARPYGGLAGIAIPVEQVRTGQLGADLGLDPQRPFGRGHPNPRWSRSRAGFAATRAASYRPRPLSSTS